MSYYKKGTPAKTQRRSRKDRPQSTLKIIICGIAVLAVCASAFAYFFFTSDSPTEPNKYSLTMSQGFNKADSFLKSGEFDNAVVVYDNMQIDAKYEADKYTLTLYKAHALFSNADPAGARAAIALLGDMITDPDAAPMFRGWAISELLQFYYSSLSPEIFSEIKALPAFESLNGLDDAEFLQEVALRSDQIYPTALGKIHLVIPVARALTYDTSLDSDVAEAYATRIELMVSDSKRLQADDKLFDSPYHNMMLAHYRGIVLSAASKGGADPDLAREEFKEALRIANTYKTDATLQQLSWYTHFFFAAHELEYGKESNTDTATAQLALLIDSIKKAKDPSLFHAFVHAAHDNPQSNNFRLFASLAAHDEKFAAFLQNEFDLSF